MATMRRRWIRILINHGGPLVEIVQARLENTTGHGGTGHVVGQRVGLEKDD